MLDPSRPAIVVGTVDMIGSRLLFSGYGDGRSRRPFHAGLLGQDAWIVLDEAHLTPPFGELLRSIRDAQQGYPRFAPFKISLLSATQRVSEDSEHISIEPEDEINPIIGMRLAAKKHLRIHQLNEKDNEAKKIVELAAVHSEAKMRVIIYVQSPKTATEVSKQLEKLTSKSRCPIRVLTGTLRGFERDVLAVDPVFSGFRSDPLRQPPDVTHYLVSTSAGEVGADLDADHLICDLTPLDSLIQRFGRVNRLGLGDAIVDLVISAKLVNDGQKNKVLDYLQSLHQDEQGCYSVNPNALINQPLAAFSSAPLTIPLAAHWLDMWSLTSIRDADWPERPEVAPWLHGMISDLPETWIVWRTDIEWLAKSDVKEIDCERVFEIYGIQPHEQLKEPTCSIREKLNKLSLSRNNANQSAILLGSDGSLVWRGTLGELVDIEKNGTVSLNFATVLIPPYMGGLSKEGFFDPGEPSASDVADQRFPSRQRLLAQGNVNGWKADRFPVTCSNEDAARYESDSLPIVILNIANNTGMKFVASVQVGGHDETENGTARYLLYFTDPLSAAQSSAVSFISGEKQTLIEHTNRVGMLIADIAHRTNLTEDYSSAMKIAGSHHDTGKNRRCWQLAIGNPDLTQPLAKSNHARFSHLFSSGYRHEFGSLIETLKMADIDDNPHRDLILHLIASHHGHARPHFKENGFDKDTSLTTCRAVALEVSQRFGLLQARYGWWTLAWLEALLKASDALISTGYNQGDTYE